MTTLLAVIYTIKVMSPYIIKMCRFKSTWKLLIKYILRPYISQEESCSDFLLVYDHCWRSSTMFWPPGSSNAQNMAKWILSMWMLMFKHRVSMTAGPPFSIFDRYEHDLELPPEHLDFQTCGKQPFLVPTSSFCSIGHNDRERWFSNRGIWNE